MEKIDDNKQDLLSSMICICYILLAVFIFSLSTINLWNESRPASFVRYMVFTLILFSLIVFASSRELINKRFIFPILLFVSAMLINAAWVSLINTEPQSDFYLLHRYAEEYSRGDNSLGGDRYFINWSYQCGFVAWMAFWMKFFGAGIGFFKFTNCLFGAFTNVLVYLLARRMASERGARAAGIIFLIYPGTHFFVSVLTNQHLSDLLLLLSLYALTSPGGGRKGRLVLAAVSGVLIALGDAIRPIGIVVILAVIASCLVRLMACLRNRREEIGLVLLRTAIVIAAYLLVSAGLSVAVKLSGMNENGLSNNRPEWKYIVGLNTESDGTYNIEDEEAVLGEGATQEAIDELLKERKSIGISDFLKLTYRKSQIMWGAFEPIAFAFTENVREDYYRQPPRPSFEDITTRLVKFTAGIYIWIYVLIALGTAFQLQQRKYSEIFNLLALIALAYFCAHLLIEVQSRYRVLMNVVSFPISALGVDAILKLFKNRGKAG